MGVGSIPVVILSACQDMKTIALQFLKHEYSWVVKPLTAAQWAWVSIMAKRHTVAEVLPLRCFIYYNQIAANQKSLSVSPEVKGKTCNIILTF